MVTSARVQRPGSRMALTRRIRQLLSLVAVLLALWPLAAAGRERFPDRLELVGLLRRAQFEELEARLTTYQESFEAGRISENVVDAAFFAFANSDLALEPRFSQWLLRFPDSYAAPLARGVYYWQLGWLSRGGGYVRNTPKLRFAEMRNYLLLAVPNLRLAIRLNPKLSVAHGFLVSLGKVSGTGVSTERALEVGLRAVPRSAVIRARYLFGHLPRWGGSLLEIWYFTERTKREFPDEPRLKFLEGFYDYALAETLARRGERKKAVAYYDQAISYGEYRNYYLARGKNFYGLKDYERALADFDTALKIRPQVAAILDWRARAYKRLGRYYEAFADWELALQIDSLNPDILRQRAWALRDKKRYRKAVEDLTKALQFGAYDARVHNARGFLYTYHLKQYDQAIIDLKRATLLAPKGARYWYNLANALFRNLDCEFLAAANTYVRLCKSGASCPSNQLEWTEGALIHFSSANECSMR